MKSFFRRLRIRLQLLALEISHFANLHDCAEAHNAGRDVTELWLGYAANYHRRRAELKRQLHGPITSWLDEACCHCKSCGWSDFESELTQGRCPDCGSAVTHPTPEVATPHQQRDQSTFERRP